MLSYLSNPHRFMAFSRIAQPAFYALAVVAIGYSVWQGLFVVPEDIKHSDGVRMLFVHVPSAWLAMASYMSMAVASFIWFIWRHELADIAAKTIAPYGAAYTALCLSTGSIWGRPAWGTWWEWDDSRMVSVLIMLFLYLGYMALRAALPSRQQAARAGAILAMVGVINIPLIKFSVDWFTSLHQDASIIREGGPAISGAFAIPLFAGILGHTMLFSALVLTAMRTEILSRQVTRARAVLLTPESQT